MSFHFSGRSAVIDAVLARAPGVISFQDVGEVTCIVWNVTVTFAVIIIISLILDGIEFFERVALHMTPAG
ncbi:ArsB/NhaD family transporter [Alkalicoccus saliphilus]|uniref:ArsB/NhaD family transporter n=1 Tax=Alkalicoccus saliphilus TaxID=200989 RepID=UPI002481F90D|nr:ArsB/NhaD family transporter [Alkalicoccus saliphilus]